MVLRTRSFPRISLAALAGLAAVALGVLAAIGGVALGIAVLSTQQPISQVVTACVLIVAGAVNVQSALGIGGEARRALLRSVVVTIGLVLYLGAGLRDFGEFFWLYAAYLLLVLTLLNRASTRARIAA